MNSQYGYVIRTRINNKVQHDACLSHIVNGMSAHGNIMFSNRVRVINFMKEISFYNLILGMHR